MSGRPQFTLGWRVIGWCEEWLVTPDGPNAGEPWEWTASQVEFLLRFYAVDRDGNWLFRRAALRWAKGRGKSPALAALALAELCAPVVFEGIGDPDEFEPDGRVEAKAHPMPWVQLAATAEYQTVNTMSLVSAMAPKGSPIVREHGLDVGKTIIYKPGGGRLEVITASARAAEGGRPTFVVMDEVQEWVPSNGGVALAETIRRNLAKTGGRSIEAGNAHSPGFGSVGERTFDAWQAQESGRTRGTGILYDSLEAPPDTNLADPVSLRKGLEVAYRDAWWVDLERIAGEVHDPSTPASVSRRYYLNQITAEDDAWVTPQEWQRLKTVRPLVDGEPVVLFFDGSKSDDATALIGCTMSDGHVFRLGVWQPSGRGDEVPVNEIDRTVGRAFERFEVVGFFADVQEWQSFVRVAWPQKYAAGLLVDALPHGKEPAPIAWDMRSHAYDFTMAAETCHAEILEQQFTHDGDPDVERHVINAKRRPNRWGVSVGKETKDSPRKIDAAVCVIGARMVRRLVLASPAWQRRSRKPAGKGRVVVMA